MAAKAALWWLSGAPARESRPLHVFSTEMLFAGLRLLCPGACRFAVLGHGLRHGLMGRAAHVETGGVWRFWRRRYRGSLCLK